jgi:hypothetical protein
MTITPIFDATGRQVGMAGVFSEEERLALAVPAGAPLPGDHSDKLAALVMMAEQDDPVRLAALVEQIRAARAVPVGIEDIPTMPLKVEP